MAQGPARESLDSRYWDVYLQEILLTCPHGPNGSRYLSPRTKWPKVPVPTNHVQGTCPHEPEVIMDFRKIVEKNITEYEMFESGDGILVGVSGGADSLSLLHVLMVIGKERGWIVAAAHLNHCFRGEEADRDQTHVIQICKKWNIPLLDRKIDVQAIADEKGMSSEEAGREVRYALFEEAMKKFGCNKKAVAQNMDDQAETVLMNLIRGSGTEGLKGMEFVRGNIYRPLLNIPRFEIEKYCDENFISYVNDSTNFEPIYARNKIRLQLLPYIKKTFNPAITENLFRLSRGASEENDFLEQLGRVTLAKIRETEGDTDSYYNLDTNPDSDKEIKILAGELIKLHPAMAKRVLRIAIREVAGDLKGIERKHVDAALKIAGEHTGSACQLPNKIRIKKSYDWLIISKERQNTLIDVEKNGQKCYHILVYGKNILPDGTIVEMEKLELETEKELKKEFMTEYLDFKKLNTQLVARYRMAGDRFTPIGMRGSKKLKNFFIDRKIPKEKREDFLLICDGREVVWVTSDVISERYKLDKDSSEILKIKIIQGE